MVTEALTYPFSMQSAVTSNEYTYINANHLTLGLAMTYMDHARHKVNPCNAW